MKQLLFAIAVLIFNTTNAQIRIDEKMHHLKSNDLEIEVTFGDVEIQSWDKDYIHITGTADGKNVNMYEIYDFESENKRSAIEITSDLDMEDDCSHKNVDIDIDLLVRVPKGMNIDADIIFGDIKMVGAFGKQEIDIEFGDVDIIKDDTDDDNISIESEFGAVDISLKESSKYSIMVDQEFGDVKTDLPLIVSSRGKDMFEGSYVYKLNGGGGKIEIDSEFGNIYLRDVKNKDNNK